MVESNKKLTTSKKTEKLETKAEPVKAPVTKSSTQTVIIAVLTTVIVCAIVVFGILLATGVIKFGNNMPTGNQTSQTQPSNKTDGPSSSEIINNPNPRVTVKDSTPVNVQYLEFYLPDDFKAGGKNNDGAYTYNLTDDEGWAQVLVYAEKSNLTPEKYLMKISPYLDITDTDYRMNGTKWVQGETGNTLAYATELDGTIYAVYYAVKLDSEDTSEAMSMIPKTLYMQKIYAE